jgi:hypothetical protein
MFRRALSRIAGLVRRANGQAELLHRLERHFEDVKWYIRDRHTTAQDGAVAMAQLGPRLRRDPETVARLAIVTTLPPDETGVATFSLRHVMATKVAIDVFTPVRDTAQFLRLAARTDVATSKKAHLHPLSAMLTMDTLNPYTRIVFVLGNSEHNAEVFRLMEEVARDDWARRCVCYLHDPCCHNVVRIAKRLSGQALRSYLQRLYDVSLPSDQDDPWVVMESAVGSGLLGARAVAEAGVSQIVTNSETAARLIENDLGEDYLADTKVSALFLHVPDREPGVDAARRQRPSGGIRVGSFGIANPGKLTDLVIDAVDAMRSQGTEITLVLAGYNAISFVRHRFGGTAPYWVDAVEPSSEQELQMEMAGCDVAIQLRARNLGESSGVVPVLIGMGVPTIVSRIGAFRDYGDAVLMFDGSRPQELCSAIEAALVLNPSPMTAYASRHNIRAFERAFRNAIATPADAAPELAGPVQSWMA